MSKKVYIFLADGFEDIEGLTVVDLLRRAEIDIKTVSIKETKQIQTSHGITMLTDTTFAETDFADADMLVLPGGMPGTKYLAGYKPLTDLLTDFNSKGKKSPLSVLHQVYSQVLDFSETAKPPLIRPLWKSLPETVLRPVKTVWW